MDTRAEFDELNALDLADLVRTGQVDPETLLDALPDGASLRRRGGRGVVTVGGPCSRGHPPGSP